MFPHAFTKMSSIKQNLTYCFMNNQSIVYFLLVILESFFSSILQKIQELLSLYFLFLKINIFRFFSSNGKFFIFLHYFFFAYIFQFPHLKCINFSSENSLEIVQTINDVINLHKFKMFNQF